ncbi:MAG: hypothetical protein JOZ05_13895 [Acetobacteraceae bacterium]|nr:hypothetical protein [Acetobacteraceae bacterium]
MTEIWSSLVVLGLLCGSAALGFYVRPRLPEAHTTPEATDVIRLISGMLVTFAVIVLGLLTTSVKSAFDAADHDRGQYAARLTELDQCLRNYGPEADPARAELRNYTAAVIVSTWPSAKLPAGVVRPDTTGLPRMGESDALWRILNRVNLEILHLQPRDGLQQKLQADCAELFKEVTRQRWTIIEEARGSVSRPFYVVLMFWLMIVFASFGLYAPRNGMVLVAVAIAAICLTSSIFVILDMDVPYGGLFGISSHAMGDALVHMAR